MEDKARNNLERITKYLTGVDKNLYEGISILQDPLPQCLGGQDKLLLPYLSFYFTSKEIEEENLTGVVGARIDKAEATFLKAISSAREFLRDMIIYKENEKQFKVREE